MCIGIKLAFISKSNNDFSSLALLLPKVYKKKLYVKGNTDDKIRLGR